MSAEEWKETFFCRNDVLQPIWTILNIYIVDILVFIANFFFQIITFSLTSFSCHFYCGAPAQ